MRKDGRFAVRVRLETAERIRSRGLDVHLAAPDEAFGNLYSRIANERLKNFVKPQRTTGPLLRALLYGQLAVGVLVIGERPDENLRGIVLRKGLEVLPE